MNLSLGASVAPRRPIAENWKQGSQSGDRVTSTELLPGVVESQSDCKFKCEGDARRHDGAGSDDFFEPELFHEASPRAGSNLLVRSRRMPGRLLAEALTSMRCFLGTRGGGRSFRPAASLGLPGNGVQPAVRQGRSGATDGSGDEDNCRDLDALMEEDVLRAGDLLIQRFKTLETSVIDGTWSRARHHELIPEEGVGLASRPLRGWSCSGGGSWRWSARNRESTAWCKQGQIWRSAA